MLWTSRKAYCHSEWKTSKLLRNLLAFLLKALTTLSTLEWFHTAHITLDQCKGFQYRGKTQCLQLSPYLLLVFVRSHFGREDFLLIFLLVAYWSLFLSRRNIRLDSHILPQITQNWRMPSLRKLALFRLDQIQILWFLAHTSLFICYRC